MSTGPQLKFCPESNDLLYPKEDRERKKLIYQCRNCGYQEDAAPSQYCVYRHSSIASLLPCNAVQPNSGLPHRLKLSPTYVTLWQERDHAQPQGEDCGAARRAR